MTISGIIKEAGLPSSFSFNFFHRRGILPQEGILFKTGDMGISCYTYRTLPQRTLLFLRWHPIISPSQCLFCTAVNTYIALQSSEFSVAWLSGYWALSERTPPVVLSQQELDLQCWPVVSFEAANSLSPSCVSHFPQAKPFYLSSVLLLGHHSGNDQKDQL